jgi:hypothetical protein
VIRPGATGVGIMAESRRYAWVAALCLALSLAMGCKSTQVIQPEDDGPPGEEVRVGDRVDVRLRDGTEFSLTVSEVSRDGLAGPDPSGERRTAAWQEITVLELTRVDPLKTTAAVVGGTVWVVLTVGVLVLLATYGAL